MSISALPVSDVYYPSSDGKPMAESDYQRIPLAYAVDVLSVFFADRKDVYVSGNLFVYYEQGNPAAVVAPDVFVVIGAPQGQRSSYKLWQEPKAPDFVLEITSKATHGEDQGPKRGLYAYLGIQEYWQFDPTGDYLRPRLQAFRLVGENYEAITIRQGLPAGTLYAHSQVLGLDLRMENGELRFYDGNYKLLSYAEAEQALGEAEQARGEAEQALGEAEQALGEAEQARGEAEQALGEAEQMREQAEQDRNRAEQAQKEAEYIAQQEAEARSQAETRIAQLEAMLRKE